MIKIYPNINTVLTAYPKIKHKMFLLLLKLQTQESTSGVISVGGIPIYSFYLKFNDWKYKYYPF